MAERKGIAASTAALMSVVAAGTCCLPLGTFVAAASVAGASAWFDEYRTWLMVLSAVLIIVAFWQTYSKRGTCRRPSRFSRIVLWISAVIVMGMFLFPQWMALMTARIAGP